MSHCRLLTTLKVLRNEVGVFRSLPATKAGDTKSWQPGSAEGWSWMHLLGGCQRMAAMEKAVSCPFGDSSGTPVQQSSAVIAEPCQCSQNAVPVPELVSVLDCHCRSPGVGGSYQETCVQVCFRALALAV